jgi:hypothetical protein
VNFKSPKWFPIAGALSVMNLVGVGFAAGTAEPWHAGGHAALALGFGLWAQRLRLRQRPGSSELQAPAEVLDSLDALDSEMSRLRQELSEMQERVDFTERVLAQRPETRQVGPQS